MSCLDEYGSFISHTETSVIFDVSLFMLASMYIFHKDVVNSKSQIVCFLYNMFLFFLSFVYISLQADVNF